MGYMSCMTENSFENTPGICAVSRSRHRLVDPMLFKFRVKRLRQARLRKSDNFCAFQSEVLFQILSLIMLHDGVMGEFGENFRPAVFRDVSGDQDKVQFA